MRMFCQQILSVLATVYFPYIEIKNRIIAKINC